MKILRLFFVLATLFLLSVNFSGFDNERKLSLELSSQWGGELEDDLMDSNPSQHSLHLGYTTSKDLHEIIPIDLKTGKKGPSVALKLNPKSLVISPDGKIGYLLHATSHEIIPIDLKTGVASPALPLKEVPHHMVVSQDGKTAFITYGGSKHIDRIDLSNAKTTLLLTLDDQPSQLHLSTKNRQTLYVSYDGINQITPIDIGTSKACSPIYLQEAPKAVFFTFLDEVAYLGEGQSHEMTLLDLASGQTKGTVKIDNERWQQQKNRQSIQISPDGKTAYLTEEHSNQIIPVNLETQTAEALITADYPIQSMTLFPRQHLIASFDATMAAVGQPSTFDATSSLPLKGVISEYHWDFGDGKIVTSDSPTITHIYESKKQFDVSLTVVESLQDSSFNFENGEKKPLIARSVKSVDVLESLSLDSKILPNSNEKLGQSFSTNSLHDLLLQNTTTALGSSLNPSLVGQSVTFTATVTATSGTPTGSVTFYDGLNSIGTGTLSGSQTTFSTSSLTPTSHAVTAVYSGDGTFSTSTSSALTQTVNQGTTTTGIVTSLTPTIYGNSVTFTATVSVATGIGTPTGTVTFKQGSTVIGTQSLSGNTVSLPLSTLNAGSYTITASYNGDANFTSSVSAGITQVVSQGTTSTSVGSSVNPSTYGQSVTFTANVSVVTGIGTPTGSVTFKDGATTIGSGSLSAGGVATFTTNSLSVASHSVTAVYVGDTNFTTSTSTPALSQVVGKATPVVSVNSSVTPSNFGQLVTFTATVAAPTTVGLPSGTVGFYDGATLLGTGTLSGTGNTATATFSLLNLNAGTHSITANYNGDGNFLALTSSVFSQIVKMVPSTTTTVFSNSQNPSEYGLTINLTATVTGAVVLPPYPPTGQIQFFDGGNPIGTASVTTVAGNTNAGIATLPISTLAIGSHTITAEYLGDVNYPASAISMTPFIQIIGQATSSTVVTTSVTPSVFGQNVTFTATITPLSTGAPTGTVSFYDVATLLGTSPVTPGVNSSTSSITTAGLSVGSHSIFAIYNGDVDFTSSNSPLISQIVTKDTTTSQITSSSENPSNFGDNITLSAKVIANAPGSGTPTGTVQFFDGAHLIGSATLSGGVATFITPKLYPGTHSLTIIYSGDTNFLTSTSPLFSQVVNSTLPTVTNLMGSSRNSSPINQAVTYTAQVVASPGPGQGIPGIPTGTITFIDTTTSVVIGTETVNSQGIATITEPGSDLNVAPLTHLIEATYNGDANFNPSSSVLFDEYIVPLDTTTTLVITAVHPAVPNHTNQENTLLTATVNVVGGSPPFPSDGSVTFYQGSLDLGTVPYSSSVSGVYTLTPNNLEFGTGPVVAIYSGDQTQFAMSTSNIINQQVQQTNMLTTATTITSSLNPSVFCQPVTFTATVVTTQGFYTPTGSVTFFDSDVEIGTALLNSSGVATLPVSSLALGSHPINATYNSDSNYAFSISNTITQVITASHTATTLAIVPNLSSTPYGENLILSASVASTTAYTAVPTGSITFAAGEVTLGTVPLGGTGQAILQTSSLTVGTYSITATYNSDPCYTTSSASLSHTIVKINPLTSLASTPNPSIFGNELTLSASVTSPSVGTPTGTVTFFNGTTPLGTAAVESGIASLTIPSPLGGFVILGATYSGDTNFLSINFASLLQSVELALTSTCLVTFTTTPALYGEPVTLNATVSSLAALDSPGMTGSVTFKNGSTVLGTVVLNGCDSAELITSSLLLGSGNNIVATYSGDSNFATSSSGTLNITVNQSPTNTTVTSVSANPSTYGSSVTFHINVAAATPGAGTPTGSVTGFYGSSVLGSGTLSGGTATFSTLVLPVGVQTILVKYSGDTNFLVSQTVTTQTVNAVATTSSLTSSINPSVYGQPVTFTATIASTQGTPTGTVAFLDGATTLATETLNVGVATFTTSSLVGGTHPIKVVYSGSANLATSTSSTLSQVVNQDSTTTALTSSSNPAFYGDAFTLTATVSPNIPGAGLPTGSITFKNGSTTLGTASINNSGVATLTVSTALVANATAYSLSAVYSGDSNFTASTGLLSQTVNKTATMVSANFSPNPANFGSPVTLNVLVYPVNSGFGVPTGTVTAYLGSQIVGSGTLSGSGTVTITTSSLPVGTLGLVLQYPGDSNYLPSSLPLSESVTSATSTTTVTSSLNASFFGQTVTFGVKVASSAGPLVIPTGTVTFFDGTTIIGTQGLDSNGNSTLSLSTLSVGTHSITASYSGDQTNSHSVSGALNQVVSLDQTTTTLSSILNPSVYGESVTLTALVSPNSPASPFPTGSITFKNGSTTLGTGTLNSFGEASITVSTALAASPTAYSLTAVYGGDANFATSTSSPLSQLINKTPTILSVTSAINPSPFGAFIPISGTVTPLNNGLTVFPSSGTTVTAYYGSTSVGSGTLNSTGHYNFSLTNLPAGTLAIEVKYPGDSNFAPSTITLTQTVTADTSTTFILSSPNPSNYGQTVTMTNSVFLDSSQTATGTVTYYDGTTALGTTEVGQSLLISTLSPGTHSITAVYSGSANATGSTSNTVTQFVNLSPDTTSLTSNLNPSTFGAAVTFTATVTVPAGGIPTGFVTFMDGTNPLGTAPLEASGNALFTISTLAGGSHAITAVYSGDTNFSSSTSPILTQVVSLLGTKTSLNSILNPSIYGETVTFKALVSPNSPNTFIPTGLVSFYNGINLMGTGTVNSLGEAFLTVTSSLTASMTPYSITAVYGGDSNFETSTSPFLDQTIGLTPTIISVASSTNPSTFNHSVGISGTVFPLNNGSATLPASGTLVTAYYGATSVGSGLLNSNGQYSFSLSGLPAGVLAIEIVYPGDPNFEGSSTTLTQTVNFDVSTIVINSSPNPSTYGEGVTLTNAVTLASSLTATGIVTYYDGTNQIGTTAVGQSLVISNFLPGIHPITAVYNGSTTAAGSTSNLVHQVVDEAPSTAVTTTILSSVPNPSLFGQTVVFFGNVSSPYGVPTGTLTFYDGLTSLSTVPLYDGFATFSTALLSVGPHHITAVYNGDSNFSPSAPSAIYVQTVNVVGTTFTTTLTLNSSLNPSTYEDPVTFNVQVTSLEPNPPYPTGVVTLYVGVTPLVTLPLNSTAGATYTTSTLPAGNLDIVALYSGDTTFSASTAVIAQVVNPLGTMTHLTSSENPSNYGDLVTLTATVSPQAGIFIPTGTVSFYDGITLLGTSLLNNTGVANLATASLVSGTHSINAVYNPSMNYQTSSDGLNQVVDASMTNTTILSSSPNPSYLGDDVTFIASVTSANGNPTGLVTFYLGSTPLGTTALYGGLAVFSTTTLPLGSDSITAEYLGNANYDGSTSQPFTQVVIQPIQVTTTTLTSSLNPSFYGDNVTFTADVTANSGQPTGTITFFDGSTAISTEILNNGVATFSTSSLSVGSHPLTAYYSGDSHFESSFSTVLTQVVEQSLLPNAPQNFFGCQKVYEKFAKKEFNNHLRWDPPSSGAAPISYWIYKDATLTKLIATIPAGEPLKYTQHKRRKGKIYSYYIVAVNQDGVSPAVEAIVLPFCKYSCNLCEKIAEFDKKTLFESPMML